MDLANRRRSTNIDDRRGPLTLVQRLSDLSRKTFQSAPETLTGPSPDELLQAKQRDATMYYLQKTGKNPSDDFFTQLFARRVPEHVTSDTWPVLQSLMSNNPVDDTPAKSTGDEYTAGRVPGGRYLTVDESKIYHNTGPTRR